MAITEFIYPTEYEPASPPYQVTYKDGKTANLPATIATPSAFDTKNLGSTFEVEAQIDGSLPIVDLRLTPTIVYHVDNVTWGNFKTEEAELKFDMPTFYVLASSCDPGFGIPIRAQLFANSFCVLVFVLWSFP